MDEPFSHLDEITAKKLRRELTSIWEKTGVTILFVTHDLSEAIFLSDRILFMTNKPSRIYKDATVDLPRPRRYDDPKFFGIQVEMAKEFEEQMRREEEGRAMKKEAEEGRVEVPRIVAGV